MTSLTMLVAAMEMVHICDWQHWSKSANHSDEDSRASGDDADADSSERESLLAREPMLLLIPTMLMMIAMIMGSPKNLAAVIEMDGNGARVIRGA